MSGKSYRNIVMASLLGITLAACSSDEHVIATQQGFISLDTQTDATFRMAEGDSHELGADMIPEEKGYELTLSQTGTNYTHTWPAFSDFPEDESFMSGHYEARVSHEGVNGGPRFEGSEQFEIEAGKKVAVTIACTPAEALVDVNIGERKLGEYKLSSLTVHSAGSTYQKTETSKAIFTNPGRINFYAGITNGAGDTVSVSVPFRQELAKACGARMKAGMDGQMLKLEFAGKEESITLDEDLFTAGEPTITASGFVPGVVLNATEGLTLAEHIAMTVESPKPLSKLMLSVISPILNKIDAPSEVNFMELTEEEVEYLATTGLKFDVSNDRRKANIDMTNVIEALSSYVSAQSTFILLAEDMTGLCSKPMELKVNTKTLNFELADVTSATVGVDTASMRIVPDVVNIERADFKIYTNVNSELKECEITSWAEAEDGSVTVGFVVPEGLDNVDISIYYLGLERVKTTVKRANPPFRMSVDPFATTAIINVSAEDPRVVEAVTRYASFTVNGERASIWKRLPDEGLIILNGLAPDAGYTTMLNLVEGPSAGMIEFKTEKATPVPSGNFADWKVLYDEKEVPSGGRYSASPIAIVNRQNKSDVYVRWPKKHWASVNAKTFYKNSGNRNTWYMQPSAVLEQGPEEGDNKSICLTSVGWDHNGPEIPDYIQQPGQYLPYNNNIPKAAHRSAGRLFLGGYGYDAETGKETYIHGMEFGSRPSALNGYFMFMPDLTDNNDRGFVEIEVLNVSDGKETVIASGRHEFHTSPDYRAFTVGLTYTHFGIKATHLRIMFASSIHAGEQAEEDVKVPVTAYPEHGYYHGSSLWIYNLSFSY